MPRTYKDTFLLSTSKHPFLATFAQQRPQWPQPQLAHQSSVKRLDPSWRRGLARTLIRSLTGRSPKRTHTRRASGRPRSCPAASRLATGCFPAVPTSTRRFPLACFAHTPGLLLIQRLWPHPSSLWVGGQWPWPPPPPPTPISTIREHRNSPPRRRSSFPGQLLAGSSAWRATSDAPEQRR
jgi:hypothetical protein